MTVARFAVVDEELNRLIEAWPNLSPDLKRSILAIVRLAERP
jgi:hypothetical protein